MSDLGQVIELETVAFRPWDLPEPTSLQLARRKVEDEAKHLREVEKEADAATQRLADHAPPSVWRRLWGPTADPDRRTLEVHLDQLQRQFLKATADYAAAKHSLKTEERKYQVDRAQHEAATSARQAQAESRIATARAAQRLLDANPQAAFWGATFLLRVAADLQKARSGWETSPEPAPPDWDLTTVLDLWGIPYQARPRV
jgi:hypothetical protein